MHTYRLKQAMQTYRPIKTEATHDEDKIEKGFVFVILPLDALSFIVDAEMKTPRGVL